MYHIFYIIYYVLWIIYMDKEICHYANVIRNQDFIRKKFQIEEKKVKPS